MTGFGPRSLARTTLVGVAFGVLAFLAGVALVGLLVPEPNQHGAIETAFYLAVFAATGAAAFAAARRAGFSLAAGSVAGLIAIAAMGVVIFAAYVAFVELVLGGDGVGPVD